MKDQERFVRANKVLHELFEVYMNPKIQPKDKQKQLAGIIARNHNIVYKDDKFFELLLILQINGLGFPDYLGHSDKFSQYTNQLIFEEAA